MSFQGLCPCFSAVVSAASVASVTTSVKWPRGHRSPVLSHRSLVFILISPISTFCSVSQLDIQLTQTGLTASPSLVPGFTSLPSISAQGATTYLGRPGLLASFLSHTSLASDCAHSVFTRALLSFHCLLSSPCTATTVVQASSFP